MTSKVLFVNRRSSNICQSFVSLLFFQAVNKLAEIMNRKEVGRSQRGRKVNEADMRKKEKECRKLEQELKQV